MWRCGDWPSWTVHEATCAGVVVTWAALYMYNDKTYLTELPAPSALVQGDMIPCRPSFQTMPLLVLELASDDEVQ